MCSLHILVRVWLNWSLIGQHVSDFTAFCCVCGKSLSHINLLPLCSSFPFLKITTFHFTGRHVRAVVSRDILSVTEEDSCCVQRHGDVIWILGWEYYRKNRDQWFRDSLLARFADAHPADCSRLARLLGNVLATPTGSPPYLSLLKLSLSITVSLRLLLLGII